MAEPHPQPSASFVVGAAITCFAALSVSISNVSLPAYYASGGNAQTFLATRYGIATLLCLAIAAFQSVPLLLPGRQLVAALGSGIVFGIGGLLLLSSFALIPVSLAILIFFTFPIITVLIQAPLERRLPGIAQFLCLLIALGGIAFALDLAEFEFDLRGVAMSSLASFCVAGSFVWSGRSLAQADSNVVTVYVSIAALAVAIGFILASDSPVGEIRPEPDWQSFGVAIGTSVLAFIAMFRGIKLAGPTPAAMILNLEPVFTSFFAWLILSEAMTTNRIIGGGIVIAAVLVSQWLSSRQSAALVAATVAIRDEDDFDDEDWQPYHDDEEDWEEPIVDSPTRRGQSRRA